MFGTTKLTEGTTSLTLRYLSDKRYTLSNLSTPKRDRGKGQASALLKKTTQWADQAHVTLVLNARAATGRNGEMSTADLISFYSRCGFELSFGNEMIRAPKC